MSPSISVSCPICSEALVRSGRSYTCKSSHSFDLSREGYLSLLQGRSNYQQIGDDKLMVQARVRVHGLPAFMELATVIAGYCLKVDVGHGILDIGCGDGFFLDQIVRTSGTACPGIGLDISKEALAKAAKKYPDLLFIRSDAVHNRLPFGDSSFGLVLSIFAPRPVDEIRRVLRADGSWLIVTANQDHLNEVREFVPLAAIGTGKLDAPSGGSYAILKSGAFKCESKVAHPDLVALIEMSPSIHRLRRELGEKWVERVPQELRVTFSFSLTLIGRGAR